jgi:hypothetical protein
VPWVPLAAPLADIDGRALGPLWSLCQSVETSFTRRCDVGVDAALASRYQFRGQDLIVCGSVDGHGGPVPPWCPHGSTVRCGHPSGPAHDVGTSGSMVRDPQPARRCTVIRIH